MSLDTDHPHGRGENVVEMENGERYVGPSPRAWGKPRAALPVLPVPRTIPTGVGKTAVVKVDGDQVTDHPHGRGENSNGYRAHVERAGPSPRAWGKHNMRVAGDSVSRTIPTGVGKTYENAGSFVPLSDHPHGRGENRVNFQTGNLRCGPSPRAWGKPAEQPAIFAEVRTIPTGVGKTRTNRAGARRGADHPHGRGENRETNLTNGRRHGPSPRAWGKLGSPIELDIATRTIPTGVGKTNVFELVKPKMADHPHGRGENPGDGAPNAPDTGPSPRAWGKLKLNAVNRAFPRTIPTGVGKTSSSSDHHFVFPDHPHGRGENYWHIERFRTSIGPSPRAWGKLTSPETSFVSSRTIPTGVGKTMRDTPKPGGISDHPHGRGENSLIIRLRPVKPGPSPRAWGKRFLPIQTAGYSRTIPTGVGKTTARMQLGSCAADHPHGRGENICWTIASSAVNGPSPRAWGKRLNRRARQRDIRTIPTGVGKTDHLSNVLRLFSDHPHGRGENLRNGVRSLFRAGPSPRAWGKLWSAFGLFTRPRTIPTGVGKTGFRIGPIA